jgi:hypothetical protein
VIADAELGRVRLVGRSIERLRDCWVIQLATGFDVMPAIRYQATVVVYEQEHTEPLE